MWSEEKEKGFAAMWVQWEEKNSICESKKIKQTQDKFGIFFSETFFGATTMEFCLYSNKWIS